MKLVPRKHFGKLQNMMYIPFPKDDGLEVKLKLDLKMEETTGLVNQTTITRFYISYKSFILVVNVN